MRAAHLLLGGLALVGCQLIGGIGSRATGGPCKTNDECPPDEACSTGHCVARSSGSDGGKSAAGKGSGGTTTGGKPGNSGASGLGGSAGSSAPSGGVGGVNALSGGADGGGTTNGGTPGKGGSGAHGGRAGDAGDGGESGQGESGESGSGGRGGSGVGGRGGAGGAAAGSGGASSGGADSGGAGSGGAGSGGAGSGGAGSGAGGAGTGGGAGAGMAGTGGSGPTTQRIQIFADGIVAESCVRGFLYQSLIDNDYPAFDFIGSLSAGDACGLDSYDKDHECHSRYKLANLLQTDSHPSTVSGDPYDGSSLDLVTWFGDRPADIVLMLFGTNDVMAGTSTSTILDAYTLLLSTMRAENPNVRLLIAQVPPVNTSGCTTTCKNALLALNAAIPGWAAAASTTASPVTVVDQNTGFSVDDLDSTGVHPDDGGAHKIADKWSAALLALL